MKQVPAIFLTLLFAILFFCAQSQESVPSYLENEMPEYSDPVGSWKVFVMTPVGMRHPELMIREDGTGTLNEKDITIEILGNKIYYSSSRYSFMGTMHMDNWGTVDGDHMKGKSLIIEGPLKGRETEWTAERL